MRGKLAQRIFRQIVEPKTLKWEGQGRLGAGACNLGGEPWRSGCGGSGGLRPGHLGER